MRLPDAESILASAALAGLRGLQLAGVPAARALSPADLRGNAHGLSRAILGQLWLRRQRAPRWDEVNAAWERLLDGSAGIDPRLHGAPGAGDRLELVTDNAASFALRAVLIEGARRSVDLATYYLHDDAAGRAAVAALVAAARRGVRVRVVADDYVMRKKEHEGRGVLRPWRELAAEGIETRLWRDPLRPFDASHRKLLIVDEEALLVGGRNLADHYAGPEWRDVELLVRGALARAAVPVFERTLGGEEDPPPSEPGRALHGVGPRDLLRHPGMLYLLQAVRAARRTVDVENAYYFGHPALLRQLAAARARGVRVRVFTNSAESNDLDFANVRLYRGLRETLAVGGEVWLRRGRGRTLHCKYFVADGEWVGLGSSNLDYYSPRHCLECQLHLHSSALGAELTAWFERGLAEARRVEDPDELDAAVRGAALSRAFDRLLRDQQ